LVFGFHFWVANPQVYEDALAIFSMQSSRLRPRFQLYGSCRSLVVHKW
jgi:hypothetical protein